MKFLGIDYGEKKVGIASSDDEGSIAFPEAVLRNDKNLNERLKEICLAKNIKALVLGESLDFKGKPNPIHKKILEFKALLESELKIPVHLESEFLTTRQSLNIQGPNKLIDASAAAIILQSFLDKSKKDHKNFFK